MATFTDANGRVWTVRIDVTQFRAVRERTKFELGKLFNDNLARLREISSDPELFVNVLYVLCAQEAKAGGVSDDEFGRSLVGDALVGGFDALMDAYLNFYPSLHATPLRALVAEIRAGRTESSTPSGTAGGSPASADSTRAD